MATGAWATSLWPGQTGSGAISGAAGGRGVGVARATAGFGGAARAAVGAGVGAAVAAEVAGPGVVAPRTWRDGIAEGRGVAFTTLTGRLPASCKLSHSAGSTASPHNTINRFIPGRPLVLILRNFIGHHSISRLSRVKISGPASITVLGSSGSGWPYSLTRATRTRVGAASWITHGCQAWSSASK